MNKIHDLIYADEYRDEMQKGILECYPDAIFTDASDFLHRGRFEVDTSGNINEWRLKMFLLGIFDASFHMQMLRLESPNEYIQLMREAVSIKKSQEGQQS